MTLILCSVFGMSFFGVLAGAQLIYHPQENVQARMKRLLPAREKAAKKEAVVLSANHSSRLKRLERQLVLAGFSRSADLKRALRITHLLHLCPLLAGFVFFLLGFPLVQVVASTVLLLVVFVVLPRVLLLHMIFKRRKEIQRNLSDTLDLLILCLEAGMAFDSALVRVAQDMRNVSPQISYEFLATNQEILAGQTRHHALKNLAWRAGVEEVSSIVGAIQQSIKLGTSLVKTLRIQADALRKKRREMIREKILKTPVKLIFPLLFFIFPTLLMVILGPSLINIFRELTKVGF